MIKSLAVTVLGLVTSVLTAIALTLIEEWTGFSLFTLSFWLVIPAGAVLCGFAAASGYWIGCRWLHVRPGAILALQMVLVAGATHVLIYYLQYASTALDDGRALSEVMGFPAYLQIVLKSAHYRIGHGSGDVGEVGRFGYWLGALQFIGFLAGGLSIFAILRAKPYCDACRRYLGTLASAEQHFASAEDAATRAESLLALAPGQAQFAEACRPVAGTGSDGSGRVTVQLLECPRCADQTVRIAAHQFAKREWKDLGSEQLVKTPRGLDLRPAFGLPSRRSGMVRTR
jgi:hypothetical protein